MSGPRKILFEFAVITVVLLMTGCVAAGPAVGPELAAGQVESLAVTSALWGLQKAAEGAAHTFILESPTKTINFFAWPTTNGWGFVPLDVGAKDVIGKWKYVCGGGNFTSCRSMADLVDDLLKDGWNFKQASELSPELVAAIATANSWVHMLTASPALPLLIPAGSFDLPGEFTRPSQMEE